MDRPDPPSMPAGVRVAIAFLKLFIVAMILLLFIGALNGMFLLAGADHQGEQAGLFAIGTTVVFLAIFLALLATGVAAEWMVQFLQASYGSASRDWALRLLRHPAKMIGLPVLRVFAVYSTLAMLAWLVVRMGGFNRSSWTWLFFWLAVNYGARWGTRALKRRFPLS